MFAGMHFASRESRPFAKNSKNRSVQYLNVTTADQKYYLLLKLNNNKWDTIRETSSGNLLKVVEKWDILKYKIHGLYLKCSLGIYVICSTINQTVNILH